jgi:hypothetical protein
VTVVRTREFGENKRSATGAGNTIALLTTSVAGGDASMAVSKSIEDRFWAKVQKTDGCWLWTASLRNKGYGAFAYTTKDGRLVQDRAHRFSWRLHHGAIPDGLCVLHRCDVPACVNPDHLFLGTKAENNADMAAKGRHVSGGTHSPGRYRRGTEHHNAKLTAGDVRAIRAERSGGASFGALSRKWNLASGYVHRLVHRKAWGHVE